MGKGRFVYMWGPRGAQPQIWVNGNYFRDQKEVKPLQSHDMTELDDDLTINQLMIKYPFVAKNEKPLVLPIPEHEKKP